MSLFDELPPDTGAPEAAGAFDADANAPLAERLRPRTLDELVGQDRLVGEGRLLRDLIASDRIPSMIFWGPPGTGKTTLARIVAAHTGARFVPFSAVTSGVADVRRAVSEARHALRLDGRRTILFVDEIHRFNRAQQDAFLPHVEAGTIVLIGATTENPSFEVNAALLSRCRVVTLETLDEAALGRVLDRALGDRERGLGRRDVRLDADARAFLIAACGGDARSLLGALEIAVSARPGPSPTIDLATAAEAVQRKVLRYDKSGEEHFNVISALHKSIRGSDVDAALHWLARMTESGEDPLYVARRLVRIAVEDVGLADPRALDVALAAREAFAFLGRPEGELALAQAVVYLAAAPKSRRVNDAWAAAVADVRERPIEPVPLHLRNAPTELMKKLGYGRAADGPAATFLPPGLAGRRYFEPGEVGWEARWRRSQGE